MKIQTIVVAALIGITFFMSGCASRNVANQNTGFLNSYDGLDGFENRVIKIVTDADLSKYENIYIAPVKVISGIPEKEQTANQKELFKKMSEYLTQGYKAEVSKNSKYKIVDMAGVKTITSEIAVSAVEVHFDDKKWNQLTPIALDVTVVSQATYTDASVRILFESKLSDSVTGDVLVRTMDMQKDEKIGTEEYELLFKDVKPALDAWLARCASNLVK